MALLYNKINHEATESKEKINLNSICFDLYSMELIKLNDRDAKP